MKKLGIQPIPMMDRDKKDEVPQGQVWAVWSSGRPQWSTADGGKKHMPADGSWNPLKSAPFRMPLEWEILARFKDFITSLVIASFYR